MLEYPIDEAKELLDSKLKSAMMSLVQVKEDLEYIREQITTMEVNMARGNIIITFFYAISII